MRRHCAFILFSCLIFLLGLTDSQRAEAQTIGATLRDSVIEINAIPGANSGDSVRYELRISNTGGSSATGLTLRDTLDIKLTLDPTTINTSPIAINDTSATTGNVLLSVTAPGVLTNDFDADGVGPSFTLSAMALSTNGGNVTIANDGSFTYNPPPGYEGTDYFEYYLNDGEGFIDTARVYVAVSGMIWFVNANAVSNGDGRLSAPFNNLASLQAINNGTGNNPAAGDNIFLYESSTSYVGPLTLLANQHLIGQDATSNLTSLTGLSINVGSLPAMNSGNGTIVNITSASNDLNLGSSSFIHGLTLGNATGTALSGSSFGTVTFGDLSINTNGAGIALSNGTLNGNLNSLTASNGTTNVSLTNVAGTSNFGTGAIGSASVSSFTVSGGSVNITYAGNITQASNAPLLSVTGGHSGSLTFNTGTLSATNGTGLQFDNADGGYNFNGTATLNGGDAAIDIINGSGGSFIFSSGTSISNPTGTCFNLNGSTAGVTYSGNITKSGTSAGRIVDITSQASGSITFQTNTLSSTSSAGTGILLSNADGSVNFSGTTTLNGGDAGVDITTGSAGTIAFGGNASITNPTGSCFTVNGSTPSLTYSGAMTKSGTSAGTVVDITDQASGTMTFQTGTLSSTSSAGTGISLSNADGTVNFNGTTTLNGGDAGVDILAGSGGTITFASGTTITNASGTCFNLNSSTPSLTYSGNISKTSGSGLLVDLTTQASNTITFQTGTLNATVGTGINLSDVDGTVNFNGTTTLNGGDAGVDILAGSTGSINFSSGTTITHNGSANAAFNMAVSNANGTFSGSITDNLGRVIDIDGHDGGTYTFQTGTISGATASTGMRVQNSNGGTINFNSVINLSTGSSTAVDLGTGNTGGVVVFNCTGAGLDLATTTGAGFFATGGGTISVQGASNTISTGSGTALNVSNTTIGSNGITFESIAQNGGTNAIILNTTGTSGGLTVTGDGGTSINHSGGTIQNTSGHGISLNSTSRVLLDQMRIQSTGGSGINGTGVARFSFTNGTITGSGNAVGESNIAFTNSGTGLGKNLTDTLTVTNSTLTTAFDCGIDVQNDDGTISLADIQNNTITSTTSAATSLGYGIRLNGTGNSSTVANLTRARIRNNVIRNFPSDGGILVQYGNSNSSGPGGNCGTPGDADKLIVIRNNVARGETSSNRFGTHAIIVGISGGNSSSRSVGYFDISQNGTASEPIGNCLGIAVGIGNNGFATTTAFIDSNYIVANNTVGSGGIAGGNGVVLGCPSSCETPDLTLSVLGNNISQTDGNGILLVGRGTTGLAKITIKNNTVAAPLGGARPGIRVDAGNTSVGSDDAICLDIQGNTSAGSSNVAGIGLRKQGSVSTTHDFGIEGMGATATPGVEQYVGNGAGGKNPGSANGVGDGSVNGVLLISATSGFSNCNTAP